MGAVQGREAEYHVACYPIALSPPGDCENIIGYASKLSQLWQRVLMYSFLNSLFIIGRELLLEAFLWHFQPILCMAEHAPVIEGCKC